jgi:hypothetical protein
MSTTHDFIPKNDRSFLAWVQNFSSILPYHAADWNIPQEEINALHALTVNFETKLNLAETPDTRTTVSIYAKKEARKETETKARAIVKAYIAYNPAVSNDARLAMQVPVHKTTRTPVPPPTELTEYEVDTSIIRQLTVNFHASGSTKKAKPEGVHGAEIRWAILGAPPLSLDELTHSSFDTRTPFTLVFDENQRGKTVYFCLCWENTTGAKGPWSEIVNAIIP